MNNHETRDWEVMFDELMMCFDTNHYEDKTIKDFIKSILTSHTEEAYQKGLKETAIKVDKNFVDFLKSQESNKLIDEIKRSVKEEMVKKIGGMRQKYKSKVKTDKDGEWKSYRFQGHSQTKGYNKCLDDIINLISQTEV